MKVLARNEMIQFLTSLYPALYMWVIDQAFSISVKMAGYWPSSVFFRVFKDRDGVGVHKLEKKKERGQYPAILTD